MKKACFLHYSIVIIMANKICTILCFAFVIGAVQCQVSLDRITQKGKELERDLEKLQTRALSLIKAAYKKRAISDDEEVEKTLFLETELIRDKASITQFAQSLIDDAPKRLSRDTLLDVVFISKSRLTDDYKDKKEKYDKVINAYAQYEEK